MRQFKWALTSRTVFQWLKDTRPETLTDIQRAARFYYLQQNCFGGIVGDQNQTFGVATTAPPGLKLLRLEESLSAAHLRLASAYVENMDWKSMSSWPSVMAGLKGKAVVSLNEHPEVRRVFSAFEMESLDINYTVGGREGDRTTRGDYLQLGSAGRAGGAILKRRRNSGYTHHSFVLQDEADGSGIPSEAIGLAIDPDCLITAGGDHVGGAHDFLQFRGSHAGLYRSRLVPIK